MSVYLEFFRICNTKSHNAFSECGVTTRTISYSVAADALMISAVVSCLGPRRERTSPLVPFR